MNARQYARAKAIADDERADPNERDSAAKMCEEYERTHGKPRTAYGKRPWWTLKIARRGCAFWLDNGRVFRKALRALRDGRKQYEYVFEWQTVKAVQDGGVDWAWFPEREPWRAPAEMLAVCESWPVGRAIGCDEKAVEWSRPRVRMGTPRRARKLKDGELPGRRNVAGAR
jgi:hypothetical protein